MAFTLAGPCEYFEEIRKSRFLARAAPLSTAEEANAFIAQVSAPSATHNCWAWKVGQQYRFSDDGEPGGTAGRPMLTAIEGQDCDNVIVVVTRWYGGIQLGTGGLARAYGGTAAKCLQRGEQRELVVRESVRCHCGFSELSTFKARLAEHEAQVINESFDAHGAALTLAVPPAHLAAMDEFLANLTRGKSRLLQD
ncbi:IMPACT family protein [Pseudomonas matsuisoli]|uniref:Thymidylate synthase n=1 Tax=Pseudomonas matsuisoli TaxID=1515666 RepID=A0A917Q2R2_9PSED|nr:YigZ family protein [Pseudomonas matsuisoli]GGK10536.1 thymidylate synthase [Pseudomonas matsuisoli]